MKPLRLTSEGALRRLCQSAVELWRKHDYDQYFATMEKAARLDPANYRLLIDLGAAYGARYDYSGAERCFDKAARLAPHDPNVLVIAGAHCRAFNRYEMARQYFERAIAQKSAEPATYVKLAELYERFRLLDEASNLVDRALDRDPNCVLAILVRARLDRLSGRPEEAEKRLRPLLQLSDENSWSTRIRGWYEMGAVLDAQGRYDDAMGAFLEAKKMILPNAAQHIAAEKSIQIWLNEAQNSLTAEMLNRWSEAGADLGPRRRLALLGGHPRSGTTLLEQVLDSHPEIMSVEESNIFMSDAYIPLRGPGLELAFMSTVLESASPATLRTSRDSYWRCMEMFNRGAIGERLLIDKNPSLTSMAPAFARIFPEARILVALRDPRDVCLSCFMQPLPLGQVSAIFLSLETTVQEYAAVMGLWKAAAPLFRNPVMEVRYEDIVSDLEGHARRVLQFLEMPWDARVLRFDEHARQKLVRSPTYAAVTKPVSKGAVGRWRNYQKYLEPWMETLGPFVKAFGYE
jgi:tetratricopeptide (TPR) repeat protein